MPASADRQSRRGIGEGGTRNARKRGLRAGAGTGAEDRPTRGATPGTGWRPAATGTERASRPGGRRAGAECIAAGRAAQETEGAPPEFDRIASLLIYLSACVTYAEGRCFKTANRYNITTVAR